MRARQSRASACRRRALEAHAATSARRTSTAVCIARTPSDPDSPITIARSRRHLIGCAARACGSWARSHRTRFGYGRSSTARTGLRLRATRRPSTHTAHIRTARARRMCQRSSTSCSIRRTRPGSAPSRTAGRSTSCRGVASTSVTRGRCATSVRTSLRRATSSRASSTTRAHSSRRATSGTTSRRSTLTRASSSGTGSISGVCTPAH